jgi:hypothetical protein
LAPISAVTEAALPGVVAREARPAVAEELWTATYVLMGLRYQEALLGLPERTRRKPSS